MLATESPLSLNVLCCPAVAGLEENSMLVVTKNQVYTIVDDEEDE